MVITEAYYLLNVRYGASANESEYCVYGARVCIAGWCLFACAYS